MSESYSPEFKFNPNVFLLEAVCARQQSRPCANSYPEVQLPLADLPEDLEICGRKSISGGGLQARGCSGPNGRLQEVQWSENRFLEVDFKS